MTEVIRNTQTVKVDIKVENIQHWDGNEFYLPPNEIYSLVIDYPFDRERIYQIKTGKGMGLVRLFKHIGKAYDKAYADADKGNNGYWHGIEDLIIEGISVNHTKKKITLSVGS